MNNNAPEKAVIERPEAQGLFDPAFERDACGVGFIADLAGKKSHKIVADALGMLCNLEHRGAVGADPAGRRRSRNPHSNSPRVPQGGMRQARLLAAGARLLRGRPPLHAPGRAAHGALRAGLGAHPQGAGARAPRLAHGAGRQLPACPRWSRRTEPVHRQVLIGRPKTIGNEDDFERRLYPRAQYRLERDPQHLQGPRHRPLHGEPVVPDAGLQGDVPLLSGRGAITRISRTRASMSAMALVHQRFSTNTFPSWKLAHPYPHGGAQRRDQHAARQRQLDGKRGRHLSPRRCSGREI